jgi:hypothetical protein
MFSFYVIYVYLHCFFQLIYLLAVQMLILVQLMTFILMM